MFEMLAGRPPFIGPTAVSIAMQHASTYPPPLRQFNPNVPPALEQIVVKVLEKEPGDRFLSAAEMQQALRRSEKDLRKQAHQNQTVQSPQLAPSHYSSGAGGQGQFNPSGYGHA